MLGIVEPAVIVCRYRDRAVTELRFAGEKDFRYVGHADQVRTTIAQIDAFGAGSESRSFDDGVCPALVEGQLQRSRGMRHEASGRAAGGVCGGDMRDQPTAEECRGTQAFRKIEILRREGQVARPDFLSEAPHGRHSKEGPHTQALEGPDVAPIVDLAREQVVVQSVACKKGDIASLQHPQHDG
jgi:hypothetical protein